jgi:hypothetical protein
MARKRESIFAQLLRPDAWFVLLVTPLGLNLVMLMSFGLLPPELAVWAMLAGILLFLRIFFDR